MGRIRARATDSITSSDVHGDLDWPDIHAPRLPSKLIATFLWDLQAERRDGSRRGRGRHSGHGHADAERRRVRRRDVYRRAADALRAAFLAAGVCDASSCEVRRDRNVRRARLPLAGVRTRPDTDEPDDVFRDRSVRFTQSFAFGDGTTSSFATPCSPPAAARCSVPRFYEDQPLEIRVSVDRDRDRDRDPDRAAVARRLGRSFPGFDGIPFGAGGAWRRSRPFDSATLRSLQHSGAEGLRLFGAAAARSLRARADVRRRGENVEVSTLEGWRRTGRLQDTTSDAGPRTMGPCATCGAFADPNRARVAANPRAAAGARRPSGGCEPSPASLVLPASGPKTCAPPDVRSIPRSSRSCPRQSRRVRVSGAVSAGGGGSPPKCGCVVKSKAPRRARRNAIRVGRVRGVRRPVGRETRKTARDWNDR